MSDDRKPELAETVSVPIDALPTGTQFAGRYSLTSKIGEGGMGEVWLAKQLEPVRRNVAVKVIKAGMDTKAVLARFEHERQALAMMEHPNIARVFDGGVAPNGRPYFAMELVSGLPITKFCDDGKLSIEDRLTLFIPVCHAIQHAHQKGVVHRDLKPANVLVTLVDGQPTPKVIDFGVAKALAGRLTEESVSTQFGAVIGTLEYMPPEQAGLTTDDVDTRADVYSLGVVLYELLSGLRPFDSQRLRKAAADEVIRIIREEDPPSLASRLSTDDSLAATAANRHVEPRRLVSMLKGELDWIVQRCLEKNRNRRYESASGLAKDLQRYLADEAVEARPVSRAYRLKKFVRRNRVGVFLCGFVLAGLAAVYVNDRIARRTLKAERDKAQAAEVEEQKQRLEADKRKTEALAQKKEADARSAELERLLDFVDKRIFEAARPAGFGQGKDVTLRSAIQAAVPHLAADFANQPIVEARMRMTLGQTLRLLGDYATANQLFARAREIYESSYGKDDDRTLDCLDGEAECAWQLGRREESLSMRRRSFEASKAKYGATNMVTNNRELRLSTALKGLGRNEEGVKVWDSAMTNMQNSSKAGLRSNLPPGTQKLAAAADSRLDERLEKEKQELGADDRQTLTTMSVIASRSRADDATKAKSLYEDVRRKGTDRFGPGDALVLSARFALAEIMGVEKKTAASLAEHEEVLKARRKSLGDAHADTIASEDKVIVLQIREERLQEARQLADEAIQRRRALLGSDAKELADALMRRGVIATKLGDRTGAKKFMIENFEVKLAAAARVKNPTSAEAAIADGDRMVLVQLYREAGRIEDADRLAKRNKPSATEEHLRKSIAGLPKYDARAINELLRLSVQVNPMLRPKEHLELWQDIVERERATLGDDHPQTMAGIAQLAAAYRRNNDDAKAVELFRECLKLRKAKFGDVHPDVSDVKRKLATALVATGARREALGLFEVAATNLKSPEMKQAAMSCDYDIACVLALIAASEKDPVARKRDEDRAMSLLREIAKGGFYLQRNRADWLTKDPDLASIRDRKDFQEFAAALSKPANKPANSSKGK